MNQSNKSPVSSTQRYLKIAEIHDNTIVLKDGSLRAVLQTSSINFNLKSEDEQNAITYSYQNFLNALDFPIQILVKSKKLDLDKYIMNLSAIGEKQTNPLLQRQTVEYVEYIKRLVEYADIMEKSFYVIIPYDKALNIIKPNIFKQFWANINPDDSAIQVRARRKEFETLKKGLTQRTNQIKSSLESIGLKVEPLNTQQLIALFYNTYNPLLARTQKVESTAEMNLVQWE